MKIKLLSFLFAVLVVGIGIRAMTLPPADAPPAFREYCAGRCHVSPTSVLSGNARWRVKSVSDRRACRRNSSDANISFIGV